MPTSYLVTGVSRGLGFAFLKTLSDNPNNLVIGLVRNKDATEKKVSAELGARSNVHIVQADLVDLEQLKQTAETVSSITGGSLDYIIGNAAATSGWSGNLPMKIITKSPEKLEADFLEQFRVNVIGNNNLFTAYLPLILKGKAKKAVAITSGMGDLTLIRKNNVKLGVPYSVSKAALNALVAKWSAQYAEEGVLFLAVCPGLVNTGHLDQPSPEEQPHVVEMTEAFAKHSPTFSLRSPEAAVADVLSVIDKSSLTNGDGGLYVSHLGSTTQWL